MLFQPVKRKKLLCLWNNFKGGTTDGCLTLSPLVRLLKQAACDTQSACDTPLSPLHFPSRGPKDNVKDLQLGFKISILSDQLNWIEDGQMPQLYF